MLRYFYLITLILCCIEWTFSYNYIDDYSGNNFHRYRRHVKKIKKSGKSKDRRNVIRHEYDYDRSPVEFDVASFIQPYEDIADDEDNTRDRNKKRQRTPKINDYGSLMDLHMDEGIKKREKSQDYLNIGGESIELNPLFKDSMMTKHLNAKGLDELTSKYGHEKVKPYEKDDLLLSDQNFNPVHTPEKKCTFKYIKLPFFSHNKSEALKQKKAKKRKLFCFSCPKKNNTGDREDNVRDENLLQYKIKRSYEERLCPVCRKKFVSNLRPNNRLKKTPKRIIHNSRQFFQTHPDTKTSVKIRQHNLRTPDDDARRRKKRTDSDSQKQNNSEEGDSTKQEKAVDLDTNRQLKDLEEIEKKIDSVQITSPNYKKPENPPK